jgi:hypothetical protein
MVQDFEECSVGGEVEVVRVRNNEVLLDSMAEALKLIVDTNVKVSPVPTTISSEAG